MIFQISLLLVTFIIGFQIGQAYIVKGLSLRIQQFYEEGKYQDAKLYEELLDKKNEN